MFVLKENKTLFKYILLIISIPFISFTFNIFTTFIFQIGKYFGTFMRALYELVYQVL